MHWYNVEYRYRNIHGMVDSAILIRNCCANNLEKYIDVSFLCFIKRKSVKIFVQALMIL